MGCLREDSKIGVEGEGEGVAGRTDISEALAVIAGVRGSKSSTGLISTAESAEKPCTESVKG